MRLIQARKRAWQVLNYWAQEHKKSEASMFVRLKVDFKDTWKASSRPTFLRYAWKGVVILMILPT